MKLWTKILISICSIVTVIGCSVGIYFGVKNNEELPKFSKEKLETMLHEDAIKFYNNLLTIERTFPGFFYENDKFYFSENKVSTVFGAPDFNFELIKLFGYNFTISFWTPPEMLVHENLIVFNPVWLGNSYRGLPGYYECNTFDLYLIYSTKIKITYDFKTKTTKITNNEYEFNTVRTINKDYYYNNYLFFSGFNGIAYTSFVLYYKGKKELSINDIPSVDVVEKPYQNEEIVILPRIKYSDIETRIYYDFASGYDGIYKFSITEKGKKNPFGYFLAEHGMVYAF